MYKIEFYENRRGESTRAKAERDDYIRQKEEEA